MRRILAALGIIIGLAGSAQAQSGSSQTPAALNTEVNTNFANNTAGAITPTITRQMLLDMIASSANYLAANTFAPASGIPITINPAPLSTTQSIVSTQTSPTSGTTPGPLNFDVFNITNQMAATGAGTTDGANNTNVVGFRVNYFTGGPNLGTSQQAAIFGHLRETIASSSGSDMVGLSGFAYSKVSGGLGIMAGAVGGVVCDNGCSRPRIEGLEADSGINAGGAATYRAGFSIWNTGTLHAGTIDAAMVFTNPISGGEYNKVFAFSQSFSGTSTAIPVVSSTADMFWSESAITIANVFNLTNMTVSGNIFGFPHVTITGAGGATFNKNAAALAAGLSGTVLFVGDVDGNAARVDVQAFGTGAVDSPSYLTTAAEGTAASPTALQSGDFLGFFAGRGRASTVFSAPKVAMSFVTTQIWTDANQGTAIRFETTPNGSTTRGVVAQIGQGMQIGAPTGGDKGASTLNMAGAIWANGTVGATCGAGFSATTGRSVGGVITAC